MPWRGNIDEERLIPRRELELDLLPGAYAICRLPTDAEAPWAKGELCCIMRSKREIEGMTVICDEAAVPLEGVECDKGWHAIRCIGKFGFGEIGVLASLLNPLARAQVPLLTLSTFETDYILVKAERMDRVKQALEEAGHSFVN